MLTISIFLDVIEQMYWRDHLPVHVHAFYAGFEALIAVETGAVVGGRLPPRWNDLSGIVCWHASKSC